MASTRNKNSQGNYQLEQSQYRTVRNYNSFENASSGSAYITSIPDIGMIPSKVAPNHFSTNPIEIENMLFGINSTNLANYSPKIIPQLHTPRTSVFFQRQIVIMPKPFVIEPNQRPYPNSY